MTLFIIDIDGTLAHVGKRMELAGPEPEPPGSDEHDAWLDRLQSPQLFDHDHPVPGLQSLLWVLANSHADYVYLTAREDKWRKVTEDWLYKHDFPDTTLFMRTSTREARAESNSSYKERHIKELAQDYTSVVVVDDDPSGSIERMCHKNGWTFLKACSGGTR